MKERKKFFIFLTIIFIMIGLQSLSIFIIDPYIRYRKPFYNKIVGATGNPALYFGVLRNYEYDSVVLGTSMAQNFKVKNLNKTFNSSFINVAQSGAHIEETMDIFKVANEKKIKNILMSLDISVFSELKRESNTKKYNYLIKKPRNMNEYQYLLNIDTWMHVIRIILKKGKNPYELGYWGNDGYKYGEKEVLKNKITINQRENLNFYKMQNNYEKYLKKIIKENPEINFYFFYPPYSLLYYKTFGVDYNNYFRFKEFLAIELLKYKNVILLDFQIEDSITRNLENFKDLSHYSPKINKYILDNISNKKYILTNENIKKNISLLKIQIKNYELNK